MATVSELDDRIEKCQRILDSDPNSQIFAALAEAYRKKGDLDLAFKVCKNGLKVHDDYGSAHVVMSKINLDRGQYDWAEIEAKRAADLDGRTRSVELLLSEIYIYKGEFSQAIKLLKELRSRDPENPQIQKLLEIAQKIPEEQNAYLDETIITGGPSGSSSASQSGVDDTEIEASKPFELHDILTEALTIKGLKGAMLVSQDGLVADSEWRSSLEVNDCGAVLSEIWKMLRSELVNNSFGSVQNVLIEAAESTFYINQNSKGIFIFVAGKKANLGTVRMKIEGLMSNYAKTAGAI
ncbi:MAG: tetratricopeptide repeat protein [candidate division Zixibacteria bacterium]|nr:tetratricopeptide repeat protein [candidate division Zixibacteria bacterium]